MGRPGIEPESRGRILARVVGEYRRTLIDNEESKGDRNQLLIFFRQLSGQSLFLKLKKTRVEFYHRVFRYFFKLNNSKDFQLVRKCLLKIFSIHAD